MPEQVVSPRGRGFILLSAHPEGCAEQVREQISIAAGSPSPVLGGTALVVGASTGYGLASRIVAAHGHGMNTVGVFFEKPAGTRTATAGWYNSVAFEAENHRSGTRSVSINGDAFSDEVKQRAVAALRELGPANLLLYSLASPVRTHPETGVQYRSALKPVGAPYTTRSVDLDKDTIGEVTFQPATPEEIEGTRQVMGGDDLRRWVELLLAEGLLANGARVVPYSYIGPSVTWPIYRNGTIGLAKEDLEATTRELHQLLSDKVGGAAWVSINKAVVTQASAAIPAVPLYISILYRVMKAHGLHERPIEQMVRLFSLLRSDAVPPLDESDRIRMDDWEMRTDIQAEATAIWDAITSESLFTLSDYAGFKMDFRRLFGFETAGVNYDLPVEIDIPLNA